MQRTLLILFLFVLPVAGGSATEQPADWRSPLRRAWALYGHGEFPAARHALRQTCAFSLQNGTWKGVHESFQLLDLTRKVAGQEIPPYFRGYLARAVVLARDGKDATGCLLLAGDLHGDGQTAQAARLAAIAARLALTGGEFDNSLLAGERLFAFGAREAGMQALDRLCRVALLAGYPDPAIDAARIMHEYRLPGAARHWLNQAALSALTLTNPIALGRATSNLAAWGHADDAGAWMERDRR